MELSHIIAFAIAGLIAVVLISLAARLSILVALGASIYLWWYIIAVESTGTLWLMALGATAALIVLSTLFASPQRR